ncbi:hypothetical protein WKG85_09015 [Pantoea agglomerans]|uniref:hypothetical protein n=1 Tax=Enterobacter agglomerans TaxID=549 RepID=UPI003C7B6708
MKYIYTLFMLITASSHAAAQNPQQSAEDLCEMEWRITDRAGSTNTDVFEIVYGELAAFNAAGHSLSDYSIDKADFVKVSTEGAKNFRKMLSEMTTPYDEARSFFKDRMTPICIKNVLKTLNKGH